MQTMSIHAAKAHFSRLIKAMEQGEELVIARAGHPVATLSAYRPTTNKIAPPGSMKGPDWQMRKDFDAPLDDMFDFLRQHGYATFIHGHQPATHDHIVDGIHVERWVLADWSEDQGEALVWDGEVLQREVIPIA